MQNSSNGLTPLRRRPVTWIVLAQLFGTSLWFSANSAADDLQRLWGLSTADIGWLTNAVQGGFIAGTLGFALSGLADRFAASRIFVVCALLGAGCNAGFALFSQGLASALAFRFAVGLALAGIYPLGMKLVVSWDPSRAGQSLGLLVGLLGDGPHIKPRGGGSAPMGAQVLRAFRVPAFRASAFGYFGHMWELYTFWTLVPLLLAPVLALLVLWGIAVIADSLPGPIFGLIAMRRLLRPAHGG